MSHVQIKLGQAISFGLGRAPTNEVFMSPVQVRFEEDREVPQFDDDGVEKESKLVKGKAVLTWSANDRPGPAATSSHPIELRLDDDKTKWLRDLMTNKTQAVLAEAARAARGG